MKNYDIVIKAMDNNQIIELLEGKKGYKYEDKLCGGPTNPLMILELIYRVYIEENRKEILGLFIESLKKMIDGSSEDLFNSILYFMYQLDCEAENEAPFYIDKCFFESIIKDKLYKNKEILKQDRTVENINGTVWDAIIDMADSLKEYGVNIID